MGASGFVNLLIVGLFHTGLLYVLYFSSLKDLKGQEAAILSYVDPLVAVFVSVIFLGEAIGLLQILGGLLILGFTLLNEIDLKRVKRIND
jgi:drug/metabolite transporter (DMT)-like permease